MILIQFSSAQGPDECALATYKALHFFLKEAKTYDVDAQIQECEEGRKLGTVRSVLLSLDGEQANSHI